MKFHLFMSALALSTCASAPSVANACSQPSCLPGSVIPMGGTAPQNSLAFVWERPEVIFSLSGTADAGPGAPRLYRALADGGVGEALAFDLLDASSKRVVVQPRQALNSSESVIFEYDQPCPQSGEKVVRSQVMVTESAPVPSTLGSLRSGAVQQGPLVVAVGTGECTAGREASYVELNIDLARAARPFADLLTYTLRVDGSLQDSYAVKRIRWSKRSAYDPRPIARGSDVLYTLCTREPGADVGIEPGVHRVQMVGVLPDGTQLSSDELTVELRCNTGGADGGVNGPSAKDASVLLDAAALGEHYDAFPSLGQDVPGLADAGGAASTPDAADDEGCALSDGDDRNAGNLLCWLFGSVALARRRRRAS